MTERPVIGKTNGLKREDFTYLLKQSLEKACTSVPNQSGREKYGVYPFYCAPVWCVRKVDIKSYTIAFAAAEPLTSPTKSSVPLIHQNENSVHSLTTTLPTELARKTRRA